MQGRLGPPEAARFQSFPRDRWREEFSRAALAGLETIEWIYDAYGEDLNPICHADGILEMQRLSLRHGVAVESVCADWFMDLPLVGVDGETAALRWERLGWLMTRGAALNVNRIVVPFVDASAIRSAADFAAVVHGIGSLHDLIERTKVELHLETSLSPAEFAALLARLPHPGVKVNYDAGNSASLGFRPGDEFDAYGARVGSVHLKDRRRGGGTVPLGEGDTDFAAVFACLRAVNYSGDFILQVARGIEGDELEWTRRNVQTASEWLRNLQSA